jgi:transcriptional regulator with XRE-family HTH domain
MTRHPDPQPGLGHAIRKLRTDRGWSQEELGHRSEIHPTWISHLESGRVNPTWGNMRRVAAGLGVSLAVLAMLSEELDAKAGKAPRPPDRPGS